MPQDAFESQLSVPARSESIGARLIGITIMISTHTFINVRATGSRSGETTITSTTEVTSAVETGGIGVAIVDTRSTFVNVIKSETISTVYGITRARV